jgi:TetR/AcrR family acrAB operon transcriptional repressor
MNYRSFIHRKGIYMPRSEEQFEQMREATREKIREAGAALFAQKGLEATSVQDIARRAGVSAGLLYRHYRSKDELFLEIANEAREGLDALRTAFESGEPRATLLLVAEEIVHDMKAGEAFSNVMILLTRALLMGDPRLSGLVETDKSMIEALADMIARGQAEGVFRAGDARAMACAFFSATEGAFILRASLGSAFAPPTAEILMAAIRGEGI